MFYPNKLFLTNLINASLCLLPASLLIAALYFLQMPQVAASELPQQVIQLQTHVIEANEKIAVLASDQQMATKTISALQTGLNAAHQEIGDLKSKHHQMEEGNAVTHRTANGHGR